MAIGAHPQITVRVLVEEEAGGLWARLHFENQGTKKGYVDKIKAGTEGRLGNDVFVIVGADGERVLFAGPMIRRRPPGRFDFAALRPGRSLDVRIRLDAHYEFPPGRGTYAIRYEALHESPGLFPREWELRSNEVQVTWKPPGDTRPAG